MENKVSIIVPIYNVEEYLERCLASLVIQEYKNIEIIMVDDCSTDKSADIAKKYANNYPNICVFIQRDKNGGLSAARNSGISEAIGEWLAFVDSDDWVDVNYISDMINEVEESNVDVVVNESWYTFSGANDVKLINELVNKKMTHKHMIALLRFSATRALFKRDLFSDVLFPEDIKRCEDLSTIVPIYTKAKKISVINKPSYYYYQRLTSLSNQNQKNADVSFYPKTVERMYQMSESGYDKELEFRAISELMYGMIMIMVRSGRRKDEIKKQVKIFNEKYEQWKKNPYLGYLPKGKLIFIKNANRLFMLKIFIKMWDIKKRIMG